MVDSVKSYGTAAKRWEGIGPYYAMFPIRFADEVIETYTVPGNMVLDPFAGRGTTIFSATVLGRCGFGIEISPVGWVYAKAKLNPAPMEHVEEKLLQIADMSQNYATEAQNLPKFFRKCYSLPVLRFLLAARNELNWRRRTCDRTLMALLLVYLHGKEDQALSNQMRQTKAMAPNYAINWWDKNEKNPPEIDPVEFMRHRIHWRYAKGIVATNSSKMYMGNSIDLIPQVEQYLTRKNLPKASLLLTSPPYFAVTNYHYDQWLRRWLLGFDTDTTTLSGPYRGRFTNRKQYNNLLATVFTRSAKVLKKDAVVYVRTGKDPITMEATLAALIKAFPQKSVREEHQPFRKPTQTHLFGDKAPKLGEVDIIMDN